MFYIFPRRRLSASEWRNVPLLLWLLVRATYQVYLVPSRNWLPATLLAPPAQTLSPTQVQAARQMATLLEGWTRRLPWRNTCLIKALAGWYWLRRNGMAGRIYLGVKQSKEEGLGAHAWLTWGDLVLLGGKEAAAFSVIETEKKG